jgi:hypothetical protein
MNDEKPRFRYRSAITGLFVRLAVWRRWPRSTVREKVKK